jgi:hypothetical protein
MAERVHRVTMPAETSQFSATVDDANKPQTLPASITIPDPEDCVCLAWEKPPEADPKQHHPICEWHDRWRKKMQGVEGMFIIDLDSGEALRPASSEEIEQAKEAEEEHGGAPIVDIGGKSYGVGEHKPVADAPSEQQIIAEAIEAATSTEDDGMQLLLEQEVTSVDEPKASPAMYVWDPDVLEPMRPAKPEEVEKAAADDQGQLRVTIGPKSWIIAPSNWNPPRTEPSAPSP